MPTLPQPIRVDIDQWVCMRNDAVLPKASIQRVHTPEGDRFLLYKWDVDPARRVLRGIHESLEAANGLVRFDPPQTGAPSSTPTTAPARAQSPAQVPAAAPAPAPAPPRPLSITDAERDTLAAMRGAGALIKR